eukprot:361082-Chlamydomonas_euryale.AAC.11
MLPYPPACTPSVYAGSSLLQRASECMATLKRSGGKSVIGCFTSLGRCAGPGLRTTVQLRDRHRHAVYDAAKVGVGRSNNVLLPLILVGPAGSPGVAG